MGRGKVFAHKTLPQTTTARLCGEHALEPQLVRTPLFSAIGRTGRTAWLEPVAGQNCLSPSWLECIRMLTNVNSC